MHSVRGRILRFMVHAVLVVAACVVLTPLVWLVCAAFKGPDDMFHYTFASPHPTLANFRSLFAQVPFFRYFANTVFVSTAVTLLQLLLSSLTGFALAKYEFRGKGVVMALVLATMMIPVQVLMAPLYKLIYRM